MAARISSSTAAARLVVAAIAVVVLAAATATAQLVDEDLYQPRDPCPQAESIIRQAVKEEFDRNNQITAGFLRVFFHDCFSGGCDASILLDAEWNMGPNAGSVQPRVRQLVNEIRAKVNSQCPADAVSCADILALATRDSVAAAKGPFVPMRKGRFDSRAPGNTGKLPGPNDGIDALLDTFKQFGLSDPADLVALSGGHTVGKTRACFLVRRQDFQNTCNANRRHVLDVITPDLFDNQYFVGLTRNQGVFNSDQSLIDHPRTRDIVRQFAADQQAFFRQWTTSMTKLSNINWLNAGNGQIRLDCTKPNGGRLDGVIEQLAASA